MHLGFTGTRWGIGDSRKEIVSYLIRKLEIKRLNYGMCAGSDDEVYEIVRALDKDICITGYPPIIQNNFYVSRPCDELKEPEDYLKRDKNIVRDSHILIATPKEQNEVLRSGTWATIRYAKKAISIEREKCKKLYIINPDGRTEVYG